MLATSPIAIRDAETGNLIIRSSNPGQSVEIPWWQAMMMQNRCSNAISSLYSDTRIKAQALLDALDGHRLSIDEFSGISSQRFGLRTDDLKNALEACSNADGQMSDIVGKYESNVRDAYVRLITSIITSPEELMGLLFKCGYYNNRGKIVRDLETLHNRGWFRLSNALIKAYLIAMSTHYVTMCRRLANGEDPDKIRVPSILTWTQLAELLDAEYKPQFGVYVTETTQQLEEHFSPFEFGRRYVDEVQSPTPRPTAELLMLAQHVGHIEKSLTQHDMLACLAQCHPNWQGRLVIQSAPAEILVTQSVLAEILVATGLMPSEMILITHPDSANLYISGGPAMDGAVAATAEDVDIVMLNHAKVRAINMKSHYFATRPPWGTPIEQRQALFQV